MFMVREEKSKQQQQQRQQTKGPQIYTNTIFLFLQFLSSPKIKATDETTKSTVTRKRRTTKARQKRTKAKNKKKRVLDAKLGI